MWPWIIAVFACNCRSLARQPERKEKIPWQPSPRLEVPARAEAQPRLHSAASRPGAATTPLPG